MNRLTPEQRLQIVEIYFQNNSSVRNVYRALRPFYGIHNRPTERTIRETINRFRTNFTLLDHHPSTRVHPARNADNIAAVAESIREDRDQSIRRRSQALGLSYGSLWRILKRDLGLNQKALQSHYKTKKHMLTVLEMAAKTARGFRPVHDIENQNVSSNQRQSSAGNDESLHCQACNFSYASKKSLMKHFKSTKHADNIKKAKSNSDPIGID